MRFKVWHKKNKKYIYFTLKDVWENGWDCLEAFNNKMYFNGEEIIKDKTIVPNKKTAWERSWLNNDSVELIGITNPKEDKR